MRFWNSRKMIALAAAVSMLMGAGAPSSFGAENVTAITWWICPTGGFANEEQVQSLVDAFEEKNPQIHVDFRILDEKTGSDEIAAALNLIDDSDNDISKSVSDGDDEEKAASNGVDEEASSIGDVKEKAASNGDDEASEPDDVPDVILGAPEYLVTEWGNAGYMADLSDLWDEDTQRQFRPEMKDTAKNRSGVWYAVPLYRDLYTMAINYEMFEEAGALQYLNEEVHSWKDSGFIDAVLRVHDVLEQSGAEKTVVGKVYCKDVNGQRAFMSFVSNFFNTGIVDEYHSSYQLAKGNIRDVFGTLKKLVGKGIKFDKKMDGDGENSAFLKGKVFLTFNWSASKQKEAMENGQDVNFTIYPMMYPNAKNTPSLTGPVGALGVVDKSGNTIASDEEAAAIQFVRFLMTDEDAYTQAVVMSGCFPARRSINGHDLSGLYGDDEIMKLYETLNEYYGDYVPVMELFLQFEQKWTEMIREIADGAKIKTVTRELADELNEELEEVYGIRPIDLDEEA